MQDVKLELTERRTHRPSTVTLAGHECRGLIIVGSFRETCVGALSNNMFHACMNRCTLFVCCTCTYASRAPYGHYSLYSNNVCYEVESSVGGW